MVGESPHTQMACLAVTCAATVSQCGSPAILLEHRLVEKVVVYFQGSFPTAYAIIRCCARAWGRWGLWARGPPLLLGRGARGAGSPLPLSAGRRRARSAGFIYCETAFDV